MNGLSDYMCNAVCRTHSIACGCTCAEPHRKGNACFKDNPFGDESLHYHSECYFDDDGISLTEQIIPLTKEDICCFCQKETNNIEKHIKENHGWFK